MVSTTLKWSPFQRPELSDEKEEELADDKGPNPIDVPTENKSLQKLTGLDALRSLSESRKLAKEKQGVSRMQENPKLSEDLSIVSQIDSIDDVAHSVTHYGVPKYFSSMLDEVSALPKYRPLTPQLQQQCAKAMVLKIRLARFGKANKPFYNIVVAQARSARNAKPLEVLGTYDPVPKPAPYGEEDSKPIKDIKLDTSRAKYWLGVGAQPSDPVWRLLSMIGMLEPKFSVQKMQERDRALRGGGGQGAGGAQSEDAVAALEGR